MKTARWLPVAGIGVLLAVGCGPAGPTAKSTPSASSSPVASPSASPTATAACPPPSNQCLAIVTLRGSSTYVIRDITDINHPKTVSKLGAITQPVFITATDISFEDEFGLERSPLAGSPKTSMANPGGGLFTWSPDGSTFVYVTLDSTTSATVHQVSSARDRVLGSISTGTGGGVGGCETIAGCAIQNTLDFRLAYSPDGGLISLVINSFGTSNFRIWSSDGKPLKNSDSQGLTMSAWSGPSLYFRDANGVQTWREGLVAPFLPSVQWITPKGSPGGGQIVYTARDSAGWGHVYVVDTTTKKVRELKSARSNAVFLTSRYIWYEGERACVAADACGAHPPFHPLSGKTYIYDLQTGIETPSIITSVADVWPHAG